MIRLADRRTSWCGLALLVLCAAACAGMSEGEANAADAKGAYVTLDADAFVADGYLDPLTKATIGEASTPAGFIPGLRSTSVVRDAQGVFGVQIVFQEDATAAHRDRLRGRATSLGLSITWLGPDDRWPDCLEEGCPLVSDAG